MKDLPLQPSLVNLSIDRVLHVTLVLLDKFLGEVKAQSSLGCSDIDYRCQRELVDPASKECHVGVLSI